MAKTLYDYWFVKFDFPDKNGKPYKSSGGKMIYNEVLRREIPINFAVKKMGKICKVIRGVTYNKLQISNSIDQNCIPILRATNISNSEIDLNNMVYVPKQLVTEKQILKRFDILLTMSSGSKDHIGKNAFYYFDEKVSFGAFCSKLEIELEYKFMIGIFLHSKEFKAYVSNVCLGTNINNLNNEHLNECLISIPNQEILLKFNSFIKPLYQKIGFNIKQNQQLAQLRDWLLPMLMNGQVRVV